MNDSEGHKVTCGITPQQQQFSYFPFFSKYFMRLTRRFTLSACRNNKVQKLFFSTIYLKLIKLTFRTKHITSSTKDKYKMKAQKYVCIIFKYYTDICYISVLRF